MSYRKFESRRGYGRSLIVISTEGKALSFCEPTDSDYQRDVVPPRNWEEIDEKEFDEYFKKKEYYLVDYDEVKDQFSIKLIGFHYKKENRDCSHRQWHRAHGNACPCCYGGQGSYNDCDKGHGLDKCIGCKDYSPPN